MRGFVLAGALLAGCGASATTLDVPGAVVPVTPNPAREIADTKLAFDVTALTGVATITFAPSATPGATLEIGDLAIDKVSIGGADLAHAASGGKLDLALAASDHAMPVTIAFRYKAHERFTGASAGGFTMLWPYHCGNLFPCHSNPADGTTFSLALTGVPAGKVAVFPATIPSEAPAYQIAWSIDAYSELALGTTAAGTEVAIAYRPGELAAAQQGGAHLVAAFDWFEKTLGRYRFGKKVGTVSVRWPLGAFGGMEHHPRWHVAALALGNELTNLHEAAHGWFGDGVRIACWEDFVLSEGTASYLAARALEVIAPTAGAAAWLSYGEELAALSPTLPVWPQSCGAIDVIQDNLFQDAPYMRGAFFYRAVALRIGAARLDEALAAFYAAHAGKAATMHDMLDTIRSVTGFDPTACAETWLRGATIPAPGPC